MKKIKHKEKRRIFSVLFFNTAILIFLSFFGNSLEAQETQDIFIPRLLSQGSPEKGVNVRTLDIDECIRYAVYNSFEVKLAKLDFLIAETDIMYSEAVFDAFIYAGMSYEEDKRQQLSVFSGDDAQTNEYYAKIEKTLVTGTELMLEGRDKRSWAETTFVAKNPAHETDLRLEVTQPVGKNTFGYADRLDISMTKLIVKNADMDTRDRIEAFIADVQKLYWDLVFTKRSWHIYSGMLERAVKLYESDKKNYDMGLIEKVDLLASEANIEKIKGDLILAENSYRRAQKDLKLAMNMDDDVDISAAGDLSYGRFEQKLEDCFKQAFSERMDYKIKRRDVEIKGLDLKIKNSNTWPEIDLNATLEMNGVEGTLGESVNNTIMRDNMYYYAGVEVKVPIENREAKSEYIAARHEKEKALVSLKNIERTIIAEVGNAFRDVRAFYSGLTFLKKAVELQANKFSEEEKRFEYGRSSTKRIIDYQQDLLRAELEEAAVQLKYKKAIVDLNRVMNTILSEYEELL
ncbi:MAG: TolC family protein [Candidatus Omnitrophota bacterium]